MLLEKLRTKWAKRHSRHWRDRRLGFENLESRVLLTNNSGPALQLDGVDDHARAVDSVSLDLGIGANEDFTIETSFYVQNLTRGTNQLLIYKMNAYSIFFNKNGLFAEIRFDLFGNGIQLFRPGALNVGWHHVAAVFDNEFSASQDLFALYFDGNLVASTSGFEVTPGVNNSTSALNIGANFGAVPVEGWIDETRFSDTVRYSGATYIVPSMPFSADGNTRALWHFDEAVGSTSFGDASANGNTLTGFNGAQTAIPIVNTDPVITSPSTATAPENTAAVTTVTATDVDLPPQTVTFSIVGGADAGRFAITDNGILSFSSAPDYEMPADAGGDNVYEVTVQASDGAGGISTQTINVTVTPVNDNAPMFTSADTVNLAENSTAVISVTATDADLPAQAVIISIVGGADAAKFGIAPSGALSFKSPPDHEVPSDSDGDNVYVVMVEASDGELTSLQTIQVTVTDVDEPLLGDYNQNGIVDAADYTVWRDHLGQSISLPGENPLAATSGLVDQEDYEFWKANFGNTLPGGGSGGGSASLVVNAPAEPLPPASVDPIEPLVAIEHLSSDPESLSTEPMARFGSFVLTVDRSRHGGRPETIRRRIFNSVPSDHALADWLAARITPSQRVLANSTFDSPRHERDDVACPPEPADALEAAFAALDNKC